MKKRIIIVTIAIAIGIAIYYCIGLTSTSTSTSASAENLELLSLTDENALELGTINPKELEIILKDNPNAIEPENHTKEAYNKNLFGKKPEEHNNEELPQTYRNRTFIRNLSSLTYKLDEIPGYIVRYDNKIKDFKIVSLVRYVKNNAYPEMRLIDDGVIYSSKINSGANFNATALIGGLSIDNKSIMELIIQDVMLSIVPDTLILKDEIKKIAENYNTPQF